MGKGTKKTVLLIEDDAETCELLSRYLERNGYSVAAARHPQRGLELLGSENPLMVLLDVMLPDKNGFDVCRDIRRVSDVPVIILSGRGEVTDRIVGLELGADDYLPKPFEPRELLARMESVLRRSRPKNSTDKLEFGALRIDCRRRSVSHGARSVELSTTEFETLLLLAKNAGEVVSRERMINELHGEASEHFDRTIDTTISRLRTKLGDNPQRPAYIRTIRRGGYLFVAPEKESSY